MKRFGFILIILLTTPVIAGVHKDVGFTRLKIELGDRLPTGKGVSTGQVESSVQVKSNDKPSREISTWMPDTGVPALKAYNISDRSGAPDGVYSGHATSVARRMLGRRPGQGMASEVDLHEVYSVVDWFGAGMLRGQGNLTPLAGPLRVINHSWAASTNWNSQILRRSDWLTDRDEVIQVVGVRNAAGKVNQPLLAASVNAIVVGRTDGKHSIGTPQINDVYVRGRTRPHLVAPLKTGSAAAPTVTSAVILLLETASDPSLSTRSEPFENRGGKRIHDAGRPEVIRAVLMAAADRETDNGSNENITAYRDTLEHRSNNGLDTRYGAGQLNIYKAWHILNAGEQEQEIGMRGFDYEPGLAGSGAADTAATSRRYVLPDVISTMRLTTTLSWNLLFPFNNAARFDASAVLNDLDLCLYEISNGEERLVQASRSRIDTTETIDTVLMPGKRYQLVVSRVDQRSIAQDYAIAWHLGRDGAKH